MTIPKLTTAKEASIRKAFDNLAYAKLLGLELESLDEGAATLAVEIREELKQNHGLLHGGAIASLIDTATAFAILTLLQDDERTATVDLTISYLRPLTVGRVHATARVLRTGKRVIAQCKLTFMPTTELFQPQHLLTI